MNAPVRIPSPRQSAEAAYRDAYRGCPGTVRELHALRCALEGNERLIWVLDNLAGQGVSAASIVNGDVRAAENVERLYGEALDLIAGVSA